MGINMEKSRSITNLEKFKWMKTLLYHNHKPGNGNLKEGFKVWEFRNICMKRWKKMVNENVRLINSIKLVP